MDSDGDRSARAGSFWRHGLLSGRDAEDRPGRLDTGELDDGVPRVLDFDDEDREQSAVVETQASDRSDPVTTGLAAGQGPSAPTTGQYEDTNPTDLEGPPKFGDAGNQDASLASVPEIESLGTLTTHVDVKVDDNSGDVIGQQIIVQLGHMLARRPLPERLLQTVRLAFQPPTIRHGREPAEYDTVLAKLNPPGSIVVLVGEPGSGRTITGLALLADLRTLTGVTVSTLSYGANIEFSLDLLPRERRRGYLLELPSDDAEFAVADSFGVILGAAQEVLRRTTCHLVVVTTQEQWNRIRPGAPVLPCQIEPPPAVLIAGSWLRILAPGLDHDRWMKQQNIIELLDGETPRGALEIVGLIDHAAHRPANKLPTLDSLQPGTQEAGLSGEEAEFRRRVHSVVAARSSWRRDLLRWHSERGRTSFERNFLLAAATLRDAPVGEVYAAATTLATAFGEQEVAAAGQQAPGAIQLVDAIEAELTGDDDRIEFPRPGWDDAVVSYFWVDRPLCRDAFLAWLAEAPLIIPRELGRYTPRSQADRTGRAERVGSFALRWVTRQRRPDYLDRIITSWYGQGELWRVAVETLNDACLDPTVGRETHRRLLDWAKGENAALRVAVAEVCAGALGQAYPAKALVRLGHVAESGQADVVAAVRTAFQTLWSEPALRGALLDTILQWCEAYDPRRRIAGVRAFTALAEVPAPSDQRLPALLAADDDGHAPDRSQLAKGWRASLGSPPAEVETTAASRLWFEACLTAPENRDAVFETFRLAVTAPNRDLSVLHIPLLDALYEWQPSDDKQDSERIALRSALTALLIRARSAVPLPDPRRVDESEITST